MLERKSMVTMDRFPIAIGYKYNARKFLSFIDTEYSGSTNSGIPYLSKYPDQFSNVSIILVVCPIVLYKFLHILMRFTPTTSPYSVMGSWSGSLGETFVLRKCFW